jgi:hypothetical protein
MGDFSGHTDFVQQIDHDLDGLWVLVALEAPDRFNFDADHRGRLFNSLAMAIYMQSST